MNIKFKLPHNLKAIRKKWKLNQTEFAQLLDSERVPISNYEIGKHTPGIHFLLKLQDLTGIPAKVLCYESLQKELIPSQPFSTPIESSMMVAEPGSVYLNRDAMLKLQELIRLTKELNQAVKQVEAIFKIK